MLHLRTQLGTFVRAVAHRRIHRIRRLRYSRHLGIYIARTPRRRSVPIRLVAFYCRRRSYLIYRFVRAAQYRRFGYRPSDPAVEVTELYAVQSLPLAAYTGH